MCLECALDKQREQQLGYARGDHPMLAKSLKAAAKAADEMRQRKGPAYDRWVASMNAYMSAGNTTEESGSDTIPT